MSRQQVYLDGRLCRLLRLAAEHEVFHNVAMDEISGVRHSTSPHTPETLLDSVVRDWFKAHPQYEQWEAEERQAVEEVRRRRATQAPASSKSQD